MVPYIQTPASIGPLYILIFGYFLLFVAILLDLVSIFCRYILHFMFFPLLLNLFGVSHTEVTFTAAISFFLDFVHRLKFFFKTRCFGGRFFFRLQVDVYTSDIRRVHTDCLIQSNRALTMVYGSLTKSFFLIFSEVKASETLCF
jgi:hypothetical protein